MQTKIVIPAAEPSRFGQDDILLAEGGGIICDKPREKDNSVKVVKHVSAHSTSVMKPLIGAFLEVFFSSISTASAWHCSCAHSTLCPSPPWLGLENWKNQTRKLSIGSAAWQRQAAHTSPRQQQKTGYAGIEFWVRSTLGKRLLPPFGRKWSKSSDMRSFSLIVAFVPFKHGRREEGERTSLSTPPRGPASLDAVDQRNPLLLSPMAVACHMSQGVGE